MGSPLFFAVVTEPFSEGEGENILTFYRIIGKGFDGSRTQLATTNDFVMAQQLAFYWSKQDL